MRRTFRSSCPQPASVFGQQSTDEDCLFLNVFAPVGGNSDPVMVWIHGGALVSGESSDYVPARLVARNVVVVTVNYRLGALGFLAHPSLTAESPKRASGRLRAAGPAAGAPVGPAEHQSLRRRPA